ncbi:MAG: hypothetical protein V8Q76_13890 [Bacteroides intestinalis]
MTLIVSWIGVDDKKEGKSIASIYLASDSRYSWNTNTKYNYGQKVFGASSYPEIFSFCGDVLFPVSAITQMISQIDNHLLINEVDNAEAKSIKIFEYLNTSLYSYPKPCMASGFSILYATRVEKNFSLFRYYYTNKLEYEEIALPNISTKVYSGGSGSAEFDTNWLQCDHEKNNNHRTSRAVYHCLSETIRNIKDPQTGGLPQVVGLYRINNARLFGIVENGKKYIFGKEASPKISSQNIEWRNGNFERIDHNTLQRIEGAQVQPF